jgi:hypothetical protein
VAPDDSQELPHRGVMIATARDAALDNGLVYWERLQVQAEE